MSLNRYDIACDNCETPSIVLLSPEQEPPQFCPVCGTNLEQEETNEEEDG